MVIMKIEWDNVCENISYTWHGPLSPFSQGIIHADGFTIFKREWIFQNLHT